MQITVEARLRLSPEDEELLARQAEFYAEVEHSLYVAKHVRRKLESAPEHLIDDAELKRLFLAAYELTSLQYNSVDRMLAGKVAAARESRKLGLETAEEKLAEAQKQAESRRAGTPNPLQPGEANPGAAAHHPLYEASDPGVGAPDGRPGGGHRAGGPLLREQKALSGPVQLVGQRLRQPRSVAAGLAPAAGLAVLPGRLEGPAQRQQPTAGS